MYFIFSKILYYLGFSYFYQSFNIKFVFDHVSNFNIFLSLNLKNNKYNHFNPFTLNILKVPDVFCVII